ncbi:unnamed protein product, partial [Laminaria digitata]
VAYVNNFSIYPPSVDFDTGILVYGTSYRRLPTVVLIVLTTPVVKAPQFLWLPFFLWYRADTAVQHHNSPRKGNNIIIAPGSTYGERHRKEFGLCDVRERS